jgi:hypothetical protein
MVKPPPGLLAGTHVGFKNLTAMAPLVLYTVQLLYTRVAAPCWSAGLLSAGIWETGPYVGGWREGSCGAHACGQDTGCVRNMNPWTCSCNSP